jgi:hypothetical protein
MLHIPEAELHAYLDQALPRLRCVEIESHLAECTPCRTTRDDIASLRDRTTALLARLAPSRTNAPPLAELRRRAARRASERAHRRQRVAWAASVVVALGVGWSASYLVHPPSERTLATSIPSAPATPAAAPAVAPAGNGDTTAPAAAETPAAGTPGVLASEQAEQAPVIPTGRTPETHRAQRALPAAAQLADAGRGARDGQPDGWRSPSWDGSKSNGEAPGRIDGLRVPDGQTQAGDSGRRPQMVTAQQLASGEVARTIEGPVSDVSALLGARPGETADSSATEASGRAGRPVPGGVLAYRRGDRMFPVTGSLPSDSLREMMRRLNLMSRVR